MSKDICAYCGENKWQNKDKHLHEASDFLANAAKMLGSLGGKARAKKLSKKRRSEIAKKAVEARETKRQLNSRLSTIRIEGVDNLW